MKKLIYLAALVFIVACTSKKVAVAPPPPPPAPPVAKITNSFSPAIGKAPVMTEADFSSTVKDFRYEEYVKGKSLYESKCNSCHELKNPMSFPTPFWEKMVPPMVIQYNLKFTDLLDETAEKLILGYLVTTTTPKK
jgi:cytochrome c5